MGNFWLLCDIIYNVTFGGHTQVILPAVLFKLKMQQITVPPVITVHSVNPQSARLSQ